MNELNTPVRADDLSDILQMVSELNFNPMPTQNTNGEYPARLEQ